MHSVFKELTWKRLESNTKVHTKFAAYFYLLKLYGSFVLYNNFLCFICYLASHQVPVYVKCFI
jgi:hypothetical protein